MKKKIARKKQSKKKTSSRMSLIWLSVTFAAIVIVLGLTFFVKNASTTLPCANSQSCISDLSGKPQEATTGVFMGQKVVAPALPPLETLTAKVLGVTTGGEKHIYVDLTNQRLYAFEGNTLVYNFLISSGKWYPTPTGNFRIWIKLVSTRMVGGNPAIGTYYDLPNVPYTMYFYNDQYPKALGYGLHGAYWHHNFGHPMSHGCVNIEPDQAKLLFEWADPPTTGFTTLASAENPGTAITIYGVTPKE